VTGKQKEAKEFDSLTVNIMNTTFYISVNDCQLKNWKDVMNGWLHYVANEWSRFRTDNELGRMNSLKIGEKMTVSPPLIDVLKHAEYYRQKSGGFFSPYLLSQLQFHGYAASFPFQTVNLVHGELPSVTDQETCPFHFNKTSSTVERMAPGQLDLGGIGKGYAVQAAVNWLKNIGGAKAGIVDGGGDITVWSDGRKTWKIGVAHPYDTEQEIAHYRMKNGSIATSNIVYRSWVQGNKKKHHLLDGKTGQPVNTSFIQATVVTDNCLDAEVMAKLCFMEDGQRLASMLRTINPNYSTLLIDEYGKTISPKEV
jgi:FAD:protein FMN transferase